MTDLAPGDIVIVHDPPDFQVVGSPKIEDYPKYEYLDIAGYVDGDQYAMIRKVETKPNQRQRDPIVVPRDRVQKV